MTREQQAHARLFGSKPIPAPKQPELVPGIYEPDYDWITRRVMEHRDSFILLHRANPTAKVAELYVAHTPFDLERFYGFGRFLAWFNHEHGIDMISR